MLIEAKLSLSLIDFRHGNQNNENMDNWEVANKHQKDRNTKK